MHCLLVLLIHILVLPIVALWAGSHGKEELAAVATLGGRGNEPAAAYLQVVLCTVICTCKIEISVTGILKGNILVLVLSLGSIYQRGLVTLEIHIH